MRPDLAYCDKAELLFLERVCGCGLEKVFSSGEDGFEERWFSFLVIEAMGVDHDIDVVLLDELEGTRGVSNRANDGDDFAQGEVEAFAFCGCEAKDRVTPAADQLVA